MEWSSEREALNIAAAPEYDLRFSPDGAGVRQARQSCKGASSGLGEAGARLKPRGKGQMNRMHEEVARVSDAREIKHADVDSGSEASIHKINRPGVVFGSEASIHEIKSCKDTAPPKRSSRRSGTSDPDDSEDPGGVRMVVKAIPRTQSRLNCEQRLKTRQATGAFSGGLSMFYDTADDEWED